MKTFKRILSMALAAALALVMCLHMSSCGLTLLGVGLGSIFLFEDKIDDVIDGEGIGDGGIQNRPSDKNPSHEDEQRPTDDYKPGEETTGDPSAPSADPMEDMTPVSCELFVFVTETALYDVRGDEGNPVTIASYGEILFAEAEDDGWYYVINEWGVPGFVSKTDVADRTLVDGFENVPYAIYNVIAGSTTVYSYPSFDYPNAAIGELREGDTVELLAVNGEWWCVRCTLDGETVIAYVRSIDFDLSETAGLDYAEQADGSYYVTGIGSAGAQAFINIPETYNGAPVTGIAARAFYGSATVEEIIVPDTVTTIGAEAFAQCTILKRVTLPTGLTEIADGLFYGCYNIRSLVLPAGVTVIGDSAFTACTGLAELNFPEGLTSIGEAAFCECSGLTEVVLPEGLTHIDREAFYCCRSLTAVSLPNSIEYVGSLAFASCPSLRATEACGGLYLGNGENPYLALYRVDDQSVFCFMSGTRIILDYACEACDTWEELDVPEGIVMIGLGAFQYCESLKTVTLPETLTHLDVGAFYSCYSLESINIPYTVTEIADQTFAYCHALSDIELPFGITRIGDDAFYQCHGLVEFSIPTSVESIGRCAFAECTELDQLVIPESVTEIGEGAFTSCYRLTGVEIRARITELPTEVFASCQILNYVSIPATVESIGDRAFGNCYSLERVHFEGTEAQWDSIVMGEDALNAGFILSFGTR